MKTEGWAVIKDGAIDVATVSPTRRAAIVNWLVTSARVRVHDAHDDETIEKFWSAHRNGATVTKVQISFGAS